MHIFPALIGQLRRDVTDDKEVLRDWDFPLINRTVDSNSGCLEASVIMVYCASFDCTANSSKNKVTCSWFKFPSEPTLFQKAKSSRRNTAGFARFEKTCNPGREGAALGYTGAKISLEEDAVPTLFPVVEVMLMPPIQEHRQRHGRRRPRSI